MVGFITKLPYGDLYAASAWRFYDLDLQEISSIRISFLLRLLVVDPQPLDTLLRGFLQATCQWRIRCVYSFAIHICLHNIYADFKL